MQSHNNTLQLYIKELNNSIKTNGDVDIDKAISKLLKLEKDFLKNLRKTKKGRNIYSDFIYHIFRNTSGLKSSSHYFRERSGKTKEINKLISRHSYMSLQKYHMNYKFCKFAMDNLSNPSDVLAKKFNEMSKVRQSICNKSLYITLNRANTFNNASSAGIDFLDLIQDANEALLAAIDKYVPDEDSATFNSVAWHRISGHLINHGINVSPISISSAYKKKIYQINKLRQSHPSLTNQEVADILGFSLEEVDALQNASVYKSLDDEVYDNKTKKDFVIDSKSTNAEDTLEKKDLNEKLKKCYPYLSILEKKVLKLKGVEINEDD